MCRIVFMGFVTRRAIMERCECRGGPKRKLAKDEASFMFPKGEVCQEAGKFAREGARGIDYI